MSAVEQGAIALFGLFLLWAAFRLLRSPLKLLLRVVGNGLLGFALVYLLNATTAATGLSLGLNWFNGATVGILGVPGFFLLLLLKWVLL